MPLAPGTRLGPYEILSPIGAGGMGEVYRAKDTKLDREVAIKVLPNALARDPERLARFEREAKVLASLNHPNIATIYAIEDSPDGKAIAMELVDGATLKSPLPLAEALHVAVQIAEALEAAHEKGITHRDLKPANIMVTPAGLVKVLDFGLAAVGRSASGASEDSPTLTIAMTDAGMIMGTAAYMGPEQAAGKTVDRRADIWSFGVVLFEMLAGGRLFEGESVAHILADVLRAPIDFDKLPKDTPPSIRDLLRRCLDRNVKNRLQWIGEARVTIQSHLANTTPVESLPAPATSRLGWMPWAIAALLLLVVTALGFVHFRETPPAQPSYQFQIAPPPNTEFSAFRLSRDGRAIAFIATGGQVGGSASGRLWIRMLDSLEAHEVPGSSGSSYPFWSPDNAFVAYNQGGKLKKVSAKGGPSQTICDALELRGGTWGQDGTILFTDGTSRPLFRVPSSGGQPEQVTKFPDNAEPGFGQRAPEFLPDGRHFLYYTQANDPDLGGVYVGSLEGSAPVRLLPDRTNATYAPEPGGQSGYIFFLREGILMAVALNPGTLHTEGEPIPIAENVAIAANNNYGAFSSSAAGSLAYRSGASNDRDLVWIDLAGKRIGTATAPGTYAPMIALSPNDKTVAVEQGINVRQGDLWLVDLERKNNTRFTFDAGASFPLWGPDGSSIIYSRVRSAYDIARKSIASGDEDLLLKQSINAIATSVSPDGKQIAYQFTGPRTGNDIGLIALDGKHESSIYLATPATERQAQFSPDGKWMAYQSDESGRFQVYVQSIPVGGGKFQISTTGGTVPSWRRDGRELFYLSLDQKIMSVSVRMNGSTFEAGAPKELFAAPGATGFAVTRDGQRFLVNVPAGGESASAPPLTVVTNWQAAVKK